MNLRLLSRDISGPEARQTLQFDAIHFLYSRSITRLT